MKDDIHFATIYHLSKQIKDGVISPVELTEHMLSRIESSDSKLNSFATVCAARALSEARPVSYTHLTLPTKRIV